MFQIEYHNKMTIEPHIDCCLNVAYRTGSIRQAVLYFRQAYGFILHYRQIYGSTVASEMIVKKYLWGHFPVNLWFQRRQSYGYNLNHWGYTYKFAAPAGLCFQSPPANLCFQKIPLRPTIQIRCDFPELIQRRFQVFNDLLSDNIGFGKVFGQRREDLP